MTLIRTSTLILLSFSFLLAACSQTTPPIPEPQNPILSPLPSQTPSLSPAPTKKPTPGHFPIPNDAYNIQAVEDSVTFETGAPIPMVAAFVKNQLLSQGCTLVMESGSEMESILLRFEDCKEGRNVQVRIAHNKEQGSAVTMTASP